MSRFPHQANEDAKFDPPPNQTVLLLRGRHMRWRWRWRSCGRKETRKIEESAFSTEKGKGGGRPPWDGLTKSGNCKHSYNAQIEFSSSPKIIAPFPPPPPLLSLVQ